MINCLDLVEVVNRSDPEYEYLKSRKNFKYRYQLNSNNYSYLDKVAISQILKRKSIQAANILKVIIKYVKK